MGKSFISPPVDASLKKWSTFGDDSLMKGKMWQYCNQWLSQNKLDCGDQWSENGSLNYNTKLQLFFLLSRMKMGQVDVR